MMMYYIKLIISKYTIIYTRKHAKKWYTTKTFNWLYSKRDISQQHVVTRVKNIKLYSHVIYKFTYLRFSSVN